MFNYQNFKVMRNVCGLYEHKDNVSVCIDKKNGDKILFKCGILTRDLDAKLLKKCHFLFSPYI